MKQGGKKKALIWFVPFLLWGSIVVSKVIPAIAVASNIGVTFEDIKNWKKLYSTNRFHKYSG